MTLVAIRKSRRNGGMGINMTAMIVITEKPISRSLRLAVISVPIASGAAFVLISPGRPLLQDFGSPERGHKQCPCHFGFRRRRTTVEARLASGKVLR